jgi:hypothetical protein
MEQSLTMAVLSEGGDGPGSRAECLNAGMKAA